METIGELDFFRQVQEIYNTWDHNNSGAPLDCWDLINELCTKGIDQISRRVATAILEGGGDKEVHAITFDTISAYGDQVATLLSAYDSCFGKRIAFSTGRSGNTLLEMRKRRCQVSQPKAKPNTVYEHEDLPSYSSSSSSSSVAERVDKKEQGELSPHLFLEPEFDSSVSKVVGKEDDDKEDDAKPKEDEFDPIEDDIVNYFEEEKKPVTPVKRVVKTEISIICSKKRKVVICDEVPDDDDDDKPEDIEDDDDEEPFICRSKDGTVVVRKLTRVIQKP